MKINMMINQNNNKHICLNGKHIITCVILLIFVSIWFNFSTYAASNKPTISRKSITLNVGSAQSVKLQNASGEVTWSLDKTGIVKLNKNKGKSITITALKNGKVVLTAKNKNRKYHCTIKVKVAKPFYDVDNSHTSRVYTYTGIAKVDYLAELYLKEAGVKSTMSDDDIVLRIYNYLTKTWRYPYERNGNTNKPVDLEVAASQIEAYKKKTDALKDAGKIKYNWKYAVTKWTIITDKSQYVVTDDEYLVGSMAHKIGVCDYNSAVFTVMCNHAGIVAGKACGTVKGNNHQWSWAKVNGKRYFYDIGDSIHDYYSQKTIVYSWYKLTKKEMKKRNYVFTRIW